MHCIAAFLDALKQLISRFGGELLAFNQTMGFSRGATTFSVSGDLCCQIYIICETSFHFTYRNLKPVSGML